jgi:hypothetical protein
MTTRTAAKDPSDDDFLDLIAEAQHDSTFVREHD